MQTIHEEREKQNQFIVDTALLAGKILMTSGAETDRVEDTIERILYNSLPPERADDVRTFVILNALFVGIDSVHSSFTQIKSRQYDLDKITKVNQISRDFATKQITLEDTWLELSKVAKHQNKALSIKMLIASVLLGGSTALLFGGVLQDAPAAALASMASYLAYHLLCKFLNIAFLNEFLSAFIGGTVGFLAVKLIGVNPNIIMIGAVVPLVPGIAITNSIRDMMGKHYITGMIRFLECLLIGATLGGGITLVYVLF